ncbi:hypothetical protein CPB84DRAFT_68031 [Gymnopilus junonius]|uniref:Uncharacterized protein n=1 Tax=Gymnopilus junonius TaxID=109634 RepID=A0A9P5P4I5_GYMJU|nr:hypothetical protein CPB84DRAFT_68031 [Gymnopilus junonius]
MPRRRFSSPHIFATFSSSNLSAATKMPTIYDTPSGTMRRVQQSLMMRDNTITCIATPPSDTVTLCRTTSRNQPLVDQPIDPDDDFSETDDDIHGCIKYDNETSSALIAHTSRISQYQEDSPTLSHSPVSDPASYNEPPYAIPLSASRSGSLFEASGNLVKKQKKDLGHFQSMVTSFAFSTL